MEDLFSAVEARPKRRQGITGQTVEAQMRGTMCQITEYELDVLREEIARLTAAIERTEANRNDILADLDGVTAERDAIAAAAFEAAAQVIDLRRSVLEVGAELSGKIRALTPADAKAALDRMLREAKAEGMCEAADIGGHYMSDESDELLVKMWREDILARAKDMEAGK